MTDAVIDDGQRERIFRDIVLPTLFPGPPTGTPELALVSGQPGSGRTRAVSRLRVESGRAPAVVSGDELRAFHPAFLELRREESPSGAEELARASAYWARECIRFARETRHSLMLEGVFADAAAATALAGRFSAAGFSTRVVVTATRRGQSLLSVTSRYLRDVQAGDPPLYVSRESHDAALDATAKLVAAAEMSPFADRLTIVNRDGRVTFDRRGSVPADFAGASAAFAAAQSARLSRLDSTQWLSELHHCADFALSRRDLSHELTETLIDLHEASLREVIPELQVPQAGKFTTAMEQRTAERLVALRRSLVPVPPVDTAAPVFAPIGPDRGGPSR